jgi:hypothetical protein
MKLSLAAAMAGTLWATVALGQALPTSGPVSSTALGPDDMPLVLRRVTDYPLSAAGLTAGMPGPYLPNPGDPGEAPLNDPGFARGKE